MKSIDQIVNDQREALLRDVYYQQNPGSLKSVLNTIRKHEELKREKIKQYATKRK
jgi:hypothetical protein